jgi:tRNA/rRNA methyltransferase
MSESSALARVRIVLVQTSHPGNIGAAARAMKTMGLARLVLVRPRHFPHPEADAFAAGAIDVLSAAVVCDSLGEALRGAVLVVAATARHRDMSHDAIECREACRRLIAAAAQEDVALVFGPERTGLTTTEVNQAQLVATISAAAEYPSLNLAQAVQVFAYELRMSVAGAGAVSGPAAGISATHEEIEGFYAELQQTLHGIGFLDPRQPRRMMQRLRRIFSRGRLEKEEINILRGVLSTIRSKVE